MGFAITTNLPPEEAEAEDLYEIVNGQKVWPRVGEPETDALFEVVDGEKKEIPRMGAFAGLIASLLAHFLNSFALPHKRGLAVVEVVFRLRDNPRLERRPDVAFVAYDRLPNPVIAMEDPAVWEVIPNLAVEVISPSNTVDEIMQKIGDYFRSGVQLVWVIFPRQRQIYIYQSPQQVRILRESDEIDGETVLPGFRLGVAALFATINKP